MDNTLTFIGLMKKASCLAIGADSIYSVAEQGKIRLLALAKDTAKNTSQAVKNTAANWELPLLFLDFTKADIGEALGQKECAAFGITDTGFALALCKKLGKTDFEEMLTERLEREKKRKAKKTAAGAARKRRK
jgi:ribosomal protein L7Ae-like RNA K-turn-binding protein